MLSRWIRTWSPELLRGPLRALARVGFTPDAATIAGLIFVAVAGIAAARGAFLLSGTLLLLGGVLDAIDGELARVTANASSHGAFLDSLCDHCGDFALYLGLLWHYAARGDSTEELLIFLGLFGSMLGSHIRSRAGMLGIDLKDVGLVTRFERTCILVVGLWTRVPPALWLLAILNNVSMVQRLLACRAVEGELASPRPPEARASSRARL